MYRNQMTDDAEYYYAAKGVLAPSADFDVVQFGQPPSKSKKPVATSAPAAKPSAISKIKKVKAAKKARGAGMYNATVVAAVIEVDDEPLEPLSPLAVHRNQFSCLASPDEPSPKPVEKPAAKAPPAKASDAATPIARRTRMAAKAVTDVVSDVVKAVSTSPAFIKTKSAIMKHGKALGGAAERATRATRASGLRVMSAAAVN